MRKNLYRFLVTIIFLLLAGNIYAQDDLVKTEGVVTALHEANIGRVTFMPRPIPIESYTEADFLKTYELKDVGDLNIRVFMANSLTNYLHRLAPTLTADELMSKGNYQFSFYIDGRKIYTDNVHPRSGLPDAKNTRTILRIPLTSSTNEDSWGRFLWNRFMLNDGEEALTAGTHQLKIELRPYIRDPELKTGDLIAEGQVQLVIVKPEIPEKQIAVQQIAVQQIAPGGSWTVSKDAYDTAKVRDLNRKIAENLYKDITSIVVIKDGELLIEEYFNGAGRDTLHNTRSVGKSFTSAMMGIAIGGGHIKSEDQTLKDFYDLHKFSNYSPKKDTVTLKSLLTMSSGFAGNDDDQQSPGNEENMYPTADWVKFTLDLPMDDKKEVGKTWNYFTAGMIVLGDIINKSVPEGLDKYADRKFFGPLGITKHEWEYTPQKVPNTAGGLRLSSLDLAKFGQMYKNGGRWNGKQVVPRAWVDKTFTKHLPLPYEGVGFYGYLFWNTTFNINGKTHEAFFATGNGGNKIFIFKDQPLVVVITATAYGKPYQHVQATRIMERFILPAVLK